MRLRELSVGDEANYDHFVQITIQHKEIVADVIQHLHTLTICETDSEKQKQGKLVEERKYLQQKLEGKLYITTITITT